jgi:hypothetical protein
VRRTYTPPGGPTDRPGAFSYYQVPLSKHISVLAEAGYVAQRRAVRDTRQRVWLRLTETGRSAYRGHVAALHRIVGNTQAQHHPKREYLGEPGSASAITG